MNRSLALIGGYCVSIPRVSNFTKFTSSIQGWKKEWKRAGLNAGMRSSQYVCPRENDILQLRLIQLISFPGFLSLGNSEWGVSARERSADLMRSQTTWRLSHYFNYYNTFRCGRSRLRGTWSLSCWGCQLLELYEGVFLINNFLYTWINVSYKLDIFSEWIKIQHKPSRVIDK